MPDQVRLEWNVFLVTIDSICMYFVSICKGLLWLTTTHQKIRTIVTVIVSTAEINVQCEIHTPKRGGAVEFKLPNTEGAC